MGLGSSKQIDIPTIQAPSSEGSVVKEAAFVPLATAEAKEAELTRQIEETASQAQQKIGEIGSQLTGALGSLTLWKWGTTFYSKSPFLLPCRNVWIFWPPRKNQKVSLLFATFCVILLTSGS